MDKEAQYNVVKKAHQKQVTQKLMVENEEKQVMVKQQAENERLERIQLMDTYIKLVNEQEAKRTQDLQKREDKIKAISQQHKGVIVEEQQLKIQKIMDRHDKVLNVALYGSTKRGRRRNGPSRRTRESPTGPWPSRTTRTTCSNRWTRGWRNRRQRWARRGNRPLCGVRTNSSSTPTRTISRT